MKLLTPLDFPSTDWPFDFHQLNPSGRLSEVAQSRIGFKLTNKINSKDASLLYLIL